MKALSDASSSKEDISRVRAELKKLYDGLHVGKQPSVILYRLNGFIFSDRIFGLAHTRVGYP